LKDARKLRSDALEASGVGAAKVSSK